jgi:hypothetical protein
MQPRYYVCSVADYGFTSRRNAKLISKLLTLAPPLLVGFFFKHNIKLRFSSGNQLYRQDHSATEYH